MEEFDGVRCAREALETFVRDLVRGVGASEPAAAALARAVVDASARGFDTHGVRLVPHYVKGLLGGGINPVPQVAFERRTAALGHVDGDDGPGHLASYRAIEEGIGLARESGVAAVTVGRSTHHGATGCYTWAAAKAGFAALGMTNADAIVVPHDGVKPFYGTNPISFAVPVAGEEPMLLDMATSSIPLNRVLLRRDTGTPLPPDVAVTAEGEPTVDPHAAEGLRPLGGETYGYKGAGLAAMVDLLCSAFAGMAHGARLPPFGTEGLARPVGLGHFFLLLRPELFQPLAAFDARVAAFLADLRSQAAKPGRRVMAPGDPERVPARERRDSGIPVDAQTWATFGDLALRHGGTLPDILRVP
jgi:LDH2 family malate/lactate/ureidoglycolate dehydrogenase